MSDSLPYVARRIARSEFVIVRGLRCHVNLWGDAALVSPARPALVMLHGWMDVGASFQFVVDALQDERFVIAPDWRGFGRSDNGGSDCYWFPDYLGDLDVLLDALLPDQPVDLLGHSMGGNVAMIYAGVRPARVRRLVNLEGFGMPETRPHQAPRRYAHWLDELKQAQTLRRYDSLDAVAERLRKTNPLLRPELAAWLAQHWSQRDEDGLWSVLGDPAHRVANPVLYQKDEVMACWQLIAAPLLWIEGDRTDTSRWWGTRYSKEEFHLRLAVVPRVEKHVLSPAGHMVHHDQPQALARRLEQFLNAN